MNSFFLFNKYKICIFPFLAADFCLKNLAFARKIMALRCSPVAHTPMEKWYINGKDSAKQAYKIWCKNFQELLSNHIFVVSCHFLKLHPVHYVHLNYCTH